MKQTIIFIFVSLTVYGSTSSAQQPTTWTNPYFYYHYNTPLALPRQKISVKEMAGDEKQFSSYENQSVQNTLGSHVVLLTTCLKELKTTKADLVQTHTEVENVKKELNELKENSQLNSTSAQLLANVMAAVENMKKEMTNMVTKTDLALTTQRLDETHTSRVESVKKELVDVMTTVENIKKESVTTSSIGRMPQSCDDLQQIGHKKSGLFSVVGNKTVDNVYCDFTKPTTDAGFQKVIGYVDIKTSPVYFHAQKSSAFGTFNAVVPFDLLRLNLGNAMNTSGIFVAPKPGKYFFSYSGISSINVLGRVEMQLKTATKDWVRIGQAYGHVTHQTFSLQSTLVLAKEDQIRLLLAEGGIYEDGRNYTNFVGQLLEEDITQ